MTTAWAHLLNAPHIDWVLKSLKEHPEVWDAARGTAWNTAWDAAWDAVWSAAWDAAWDAAWNAARDAAWNAAWGAAKDTIWGAARGAAWDAIAALIADDDCEHLLLNGFGHTKCVHTLTGHFSSLLLQPAAIVWEQYDTTNRTKPIT